MSQEVFYIDRGKLLSANRGYIDRIEREGAYVIFDATLDALYIQFGGPKEALSEHAIDNVMLRIEPDTLHIVGIEILDFFSDFLPNNRLIQEAIRDFGIQEGQDSRITLMEPRFKDLKETLEALIPQLAKSVGSGAENTTQ